MEFSLSERCHEYRQRLLAFMDDCVYPSEVVYEQQRRDAGDPHAQPPVRHGGAQTRGPQPWTVEPLPSGPRIRSRTHQRRIRAPGGDHGTQLSRLGSMQQLGARHRQHGSPHDVRHRRTEATRTTGALHPHCRILIVMGKTDPTAPRHCQQSMILVPLDAPGVTVLRGFPSTASRTKKATLRSTSPTSASRPRTCSPAKATGS
jgi:acyl-CoA dehydrogenase